jgi:RHS repeat-associated protein
MRYSSGYTSGDHVDFDMAWDGSQIAISRSIQDNQWAQFTWGAHPDQLLETRVAFRTIGSEFGGSLVELPVVPLTDHRNSPIAVWNAQNGAISQLLEYDPHGRMTTYMPNEYRECEEPGRGKICRSQAIFGFGTKFRSNVTGLYYMRNRWYSPRLGQFTAPDPAGYVDSYNPYAYVGMDPINYWDPWGLSRQGFSPSRHLNEVPLSGIVSGVSNAGKSLESGAHYVGDALGRGVRHARGFYRERFNRSSGIQRLGFGAGLVFTEAGSLLIPQSGDGVMFEVATLGAGGALKGVGASGSLASMTDDALSAASGSIRNGWRGLKKRLGQICSFTAYTPVQMCDGSLKPVQQVKEGDRVLTRDKETGEVVCSEAVAPYYNNNEQIIELELTDSDGFVEILEATPNHPFWVEDQGWTRVDELRLGDRVPTSYGGWLKVTGATWTQREAAVYNFGVRGDHSYFVGESGAWVHNCPWGPYKNLDDTPHSIGAGKDFTASQKKKIYQENMARNNGKLRDDDTGRFLSMPKKSQKGVTPSQHEAQVDHIVPKNPADPSVSPGTNSFKNAKVISRERNRAKSNRVDFYDE